MKVEEENELLITPEWLLKNGNVVGQTVQGINTTAWTVEGAVVRMCRWFTKYSSAFCYGGWIYRQPERESSTQIPRNAPGTAQLKPRILAYSSIIIVSCVSQTNILDLLREARKRSDPGLSYKDMLWFVCKIVREIWSKENVFG